MQFFYATNTISVALAIALNEAGIAHEPRKVDFATGEQTQPDYLKINPKGRVPALIHDGDVLTETGAMLEFVAALAPDAGLVPGDAKEACTMRSVMYYLASTMHINHAHRMRGSRWATQQSSFDDMTAKVPETMTASAHYVETECLAGPFVLGDSLSLADCYLFAVCTWLEGDSVDLAPFPKIRAFMALMEARDSVKATRAAGILA